MYEIWESQLLSSDNVIWHSVQTLASPRYEPHHCLVLWGTKFHDYGPLVEVTDMPDLTTGTILLQYRTDTTITASPVVLIEWKGTEISCNHWEKKIFLQLCELRKWSRERAIRRCCHRPPSSLIRLQKTSIETLLIFSESVVLCPMFIAPTIIITTDQNWLPESAQIPMNTQ